MTGAQILEVLNQGRDARQGRDPAGGPRYKFYSYQGSAQRRDPQPYAWGAFDACVVNKTTKACDPLDLKKTYQVGTNEFLAPAGGDNYSGFKYMTNITYWGDMLNAVNAWVSRQLHQANAVQGPERRRHSSTAASPATGPTPTGSIVPVTILHHNDSHGNLAKGAYVGYTQLATLIKQETAAQPDRTLLLNGGDNIQGDAMIVLLQVGAARATPPTARRCPTRCRCTR